MSLRISEDQLDWREGAVQGMLEKAEETVCSRFGTTVETMLSDLEFILSGMRSHH